MRLHKCSGQEKSQRIRVHVPMSFHSEGNACPVAPEFRCKFRKCLEPILRQTKLYAAPLPFSELAEPDCADTNEFDCSTNSQKLIRIVQLGYPCRKSTDTVLNWRATSAEMLVCQREFQIVVHP